MVQSGAPPAISRLLLSMHHVMAISRFDPGRLARSRAGSHTFECVVRLGGKAHHNAIPRHDPAAGYHDAHDPGLAHHTAVAIASKNGVEQTRLESVDLSAWVAQSGDLDNRLGPNAQLRAAGQSEEVQIPGGDVLAELARLDVETLLTKLSEQLGVDEVHLSKVGPGRICGDVGAVLHRSPRVSITVNSQPGQQKNLQGLWLTEPVATVATDSNHRGLIINHCWLVINHR
jgi:hypothetical protein